ncbi:class IV adenylate cyclase [Variovorax paradoxus]|uniref:class IV adenylate cyclase n=1 Tax=Variovorax paradoxus TaxID=34073 RepID=UPI003ED0F890
MARNIEIKARIDSVECVALIAAKLADSGPLEIAQDDTFFRCDNNADRLKLRTFAPDRAELIFYRRANSSSPKESFYLISPTTTPDALRESLTLAWGQAGRVRKRRRLFIVGRTRVHLDRVEGLGEFLELEVVLKDGEPAEVGTAEAHALMAQLGIASEQLVQGAYVDLLQAA